MKTPYEVLGVAPTATDAEIKQAWRRASARHHPDRAGGDAVQMAAVNDAYEVLSAPERRKQFDETGTTEKMMSMLQAAELMIPGLANNAVDRCGDPAQADLHFMMWSEVTGVLREDRAAQAQAVKQRDKLKKVLKRFKRKGGENLIAAAIAEQINKIGKYLEGNTQHQLLLLEVLEVLKDYSYDVGEEVEPEPLQLGQPS